MNKHIFNKALRTLLSTAVSSGVLLTALNTQAGVSQDPLSLTVGVSPNVILTLDDSTSMNFAFVPDNIEGLRNTRRAYSATKNSIHYDPTILYAAPVSINSLGAEVNLSTSFTKAYFDGLNPTKNSGNDWANISQSYQPSWNYPRSVNGTGIYSTGNNTGRDGQLGENPAADFSAVATITNNNTTATVTTPGGITFSIRRNSTAGNFTCSVTAPAALSTLVVPCTRSSSTYTASLTRTAVPAYYYVYDKTLSTCPAPSVDVEGCYRLVFVSATSGIAKNTSGNTILDERQNFANWYSFYRNRSLATLSAASLAFLDFSSSARFTWQSLIQCTALNAPANANCGTNGFKVFDTTQRKNFFSWMQTKTVFNNPAGTPLRSAMDRAGTFLEGSTAWEAFPGEPSKNTVKNTYACRPSYHVVMTDGMWNGDGSFPNPVRNDNATFTLPDNVQYNNSLHPFSDATGSTLADIAMHYWSKDLRPGADGAANRLKPDIRFTDPDPSKQYMDPRNNPATWQHMVNYMMGLGLSSSLQQSGIAWEGSTFKGAGYAALKAGTQWPAAAASSANNVYDLWHAAINSRGEFFSVDNPNAMVQAFSDILSSISDRQSTAAKPSINSGQLVEETNSGTKVITVSYQTSYDSGDGWVGDVTRSEKERVLNPTTGLYEDNIVEKWSAKDKLPAAASRQIFIKGSGTSGLQPFTWTNAGNVTTAGTLAYLLSRDPENGNVIDTRGEARLNYLRGSQAGEGTTFRPRTALLGDFFSSSPVGVSIHRYLVGLSNQLEGNTAYTTFVQTVKNRTPRVYVGGNDGMLHGFNALTGVEEFAFIPSAVFAKLNKLTGTNYNHEFYVDGTPTVADVFNGTEWRTILVGTLRAGGKSIFALDITTPGSEKLLWEFDDNSIPAINTVKMGYSFSQPTIARLHTGKWAVIFGNGYESANDSNGKAALFIADAFTGTLLKSLEVTGTDTVTNGLSTPKLSDYNNDGVADYAYAGDLQGNLWRFDLLRDGRDSAKPLTTEDDSSNAIEDFEVGYGAQPLFKAISKDNKPQSITSAPSLIRHPSSLGYLVMFGTGKYFEETDKTGDLSTSQSVYGIWDTKTRGEETVNINITRSQLVAQTITKQVNATSDNGSTGTARVISSTGVEWRDEDQNISKYGWVLDLTLNDVKDGEMVVENMSILGRTVLFQSLVPNDDPCADGASNWTYAIDPFSGGKTRHHAFDLKDNTEPGPPGVVSGLKQDGEGGLTTSSTPDGGFEACTGQSCITVYPDPSSIGRQSWRPIEEE